MEINLDLFIGDNFKFLFQFIEVILGEWWVFLSLKNLSFKFVNRCLLAGFYLLFYFFWGANRGWESVG